MRVQHQAVLLGHAVEQVLHREGLLARLHLERAHLLVQRILAAANVLGDAFDLAEFVLQFVVANALRLEFVAQSLRVFDRRADAFAQHHVLRRCGALRARQLREFRLETRLPRAEFLLRPLETRDRVSCRDRAFVRPRRDDLHVHQLVVRAIDLGAPRHRLGLIGHEPFARGLEPRLRGLPRLFEVLVLARGLIERRFGFAVSRSS